MYINLHSLLPLHTGEGAHFDLTYMTDAGSPSHRTIKRICDAIGTNTHLQDVCFDAPLGLSDMVANSSAFDGLKHNTSINSLGLSRCHLSTGVGLEVLEAFEKNSNNRLEKLALWRCRLIQGPTASLSLTSTLTRCTNLREISISSCRINDDIVTNIVHAVKKDHCLLEKLDLHNNNIGSKGVLEIVNTLLKQPNNITVLALNNNNIDDVGAIAIAETLSTNRTLEAAYLDENNEITTDGWNAFTRALCNPSSLNDTYLSNHTFNMIASFAEIEMVGSSAMYDEDEIISNKLFSLVELNKKCCVNNNNNRSIYNKQYAARKKILQTHFVGEFNMKPFVIEEGESISGSGNNDDSNNSMTLKVMPHVLAWVGRDTTDTASHSAMFHLLKELPTLCATHHSVGELDKTVQKEKKARRLASSILEKMNVSTAAFGQQQRSIGSTRPRLTRKLSGSFSKLFSISSGSGRRIIDGMKKSLNSKLSRGHDVRDMLKQFRRKSVVNRAA